jgi:Ser/Thr protein kinase RdoA (MazF antagonist)
MADRNDDGGDSKPAAMPKKDNGSDEPSEEEMRKLLKPCPTEEQVLEVLKKSYVPAHETSFRIVKALDSYDDANYKVEIAGEPYLLKVHNGVESRDFLAVADPTDYYKKGRAGSCIHFQNAIMEILNRNHVPTNVPVPPRDEKSEPSESPVSVHKLPVLSDDHSPCSLVVRLLCWVPGRPMNTIQLLPLETLADAGRVLGRMDHALDLLHPNDPLTALRKSQYRELKMPSIPRGLLISREDDHSLKSKVDAHLKDDPSLLQAAKRYHQWDGRNTADLRNFVHCIHDDKRRHMVESVIDAFQTVLIDTGVGEHFRTGVNHGDFNDANIMVDDLLRVSGVVDFGDSVERYVFSPG